jgi:MSHA pilin protein MshD
MLKQHLKLNQQSGYSLIELIVTITLMSIVMVIFFAFMAQSQLESATPVTQVKASQLAQAYLEEISLKRYDENSPVGNGLRCNAPSGTFCSVGLGPDGEGRALFDDIDDYDGLVDNPPRDALNNLRNGFSGFSVNVTVSYAGGTFGLAAQDLKLVQVSVNSPEGSVFTFSQYKGNF